MKKLNNPVYRIALQMAGKMIKNPRKTKNTLQRAMDKSDKMGADKAGNKIVELKEYLLLFFSMMRDYLSGDYKKLPIKSTIKVLAALIYFLFIIDVIPDFFAVIGYADDAAVLGWVITSISKDIDKYKEWKEQQSTGDLRNAEPIPTS